MRVAATLLAALAACASASALPPVARTTAAPNATSDDPCTTFKDRLWAAAEIIAERNLTSSPQTLAEYAYECLQNLPFDSDIAQRTVSQVRRYMSFQSTQTYWANPPAPELELPAVDYNGTLDTIEAWAKDGTYDSLYPFLKDLNYLINGRWDGHTLFDPLCVGKGLVSYQHSYPLMSVADAPNALPKIYMIDVDATTLSIKPGAEVAGINGDDPSVYLGWLLANSAEYQYSDPDTRYNSLFTSYSADLNSWSLGIFASRTIYPEEDIVIQLANGTDITVQWRVLYSLQPTGTPDNDSDEDPFYQAYGWNDTQSLYQNFCLLSEDEKESAVSDAAATASAESVHNILTKRTSPLLPNNVAPLLRRDTDDDDEDDDDDDDVSYELLPRPSYPEFDLWLNTTGQELSYYELGNDTAVYAIFAFADAAESDPIFPEKFSNFTRVMLERAKASGIKKLLIDVSGNGGGYTDLGRDLANQLFATNLTSADNIRWNPYISALLEDGNRTAIDNQTTLALNGTFKADGTQFKSFAEELGPVFIDGDYFSEMQYANLNATAPDLVSVNYVTEPYFDADSIVVVSSGACGSTCTIFTNELKEQGVKFVAVGGRPQVGPMQAVGGIKGSQVLEYTDILTLTLVASNYTEGDDFSDGYPGVFDLRLTNARVNFRNQWRDDGMHLPLEYLYTPADYRFFYTADMYADVTELWATAAALAWEGADELNMNGGPYTPIEGFNGAGWSGNTETVPNKAVIRPGEEEEYTTLGELVWKVFRGSH